MKRQNNSLTVIGVLFIGALIFSCTKPDIGPTSSIDCSYADSSSNHPKAALFRGIIDNYVQQGLPGISVLVNDSSGTWVGAGGFADIEKQISFTPCHISKAASITKFMMGTITMKLQEQGVLSLDDPISMYIDADVLDRIDNAEGKTIRQLMNHTTGIYDVITSSDFYLAVLNNPNRQWTQLDLLEFVYDQPGYELGNPYQAHYSNTNTLLLSMCLEKATGKPHLELLKTMLFAPLGMNDTYYQGREPLPESVVQGYFDLHNNGTISNVSNLITGSGNGYGGMFSNVFDLNRFIRAVLIDKTFLTQQSLDEMTTFVSEDEDFYTGAGVIKKFTNKPMYGIGHTGRDLGYSADLFYFPQKNATMIFFVNYGTNGSSSLKPVFLNFESDLADAVIQ